MSVHRARRILPGFPLAVTVTVAGTLVFVVLPLSTIVVTAAALPVQRLIGIAFSPRALAAYRLSLGASLAAATADALVGLLLAWVVTRYTFPGRRLLDAAIDVPVALPTIVLGLGLTTVYATTFAYTAAGVTLALTVVGLPFAVRAIAPALAAVTTDADEAGAVLGATRWQTVRHITLPTILPAIVTGAVLAFARALGEYGAVVFIAGNLPFRTEIAPLLIMTRIEEFDDAGATAIATVLLALSFAILLLANQLQRRTAARAGLTLRTG
jgi:sulfate/thiosulfate transport system permease protein